MQNKPIQKRDLAAATRGLIVQRVLVDGWSPEEAGAPYGVNEQLVARWVAAYQRHGMAALRGTDAISGGPRRWLQYCLEWIGAHVGGAAKWPAARRGDGSGAPEDPNRRWRSY
jgi:transposase